MRVHDESELEMSSAHSYKKGIMHSPGNAVDDSTSFSAPVDSDFASVVGGVGDDPEQGYDDNSKHGTRVAHSTMFSRRRVRACCVGMTVLIGLIILIQLAFSRKPGYDEDLCDQQLSLPYSKNRNVAWDLCVPHAQSALLNSDVKMALLPSDRTKQSAIRFLVVGDFGRDGYCCQRDVALEMNRAATSIQADFIVNTGDTFYDAGIQSVQDEQVKTSFLNVYNQSYLKTMQFYSVLGNHEYRGSTTAVLGLPNNYQRFYMDDRWYAKVVSTPTLNVQLIFIDTSPMISSYRIPGYDSSDDLILKRADGLPSQWDRVEQQMTWIEGRLQNQKFAYHMRIVIGHHPIYDLSSHNGENRTFLQARLAPLLEQYNVTAYFSGHDHNLQMVQLKDAATAHFVSGAGSKISPGFSQPDTPSQAVQYYYMKHGFLACTIYESELRVAVVDMGGKMLNNVVVKARPRS